MYVAVKMGIRKLDLWHTRFHEENVVRLANDLAKGTIIFCMFEAVKMGIRESWTFGTHEFMGKMLFALQMTSWLLSWTLA